MHHFRKKSSSSATPTNGPSPAPTPPVVDYELAKPHPRARAKDRRALAASPGTIPPTTLSCDPTETALIEPGSSEESVWKTAYGAARIAVEIAKDSSDIFPPLKAVMVALSVLIKNYDVGSPASHPIDY